MHKSPHPQPWRGRGLMGMSSKATTGQCFRAGLLTSR